MAVSSPQSKAGASRSESNNRSASRERDADMEEHDMDRRTFLRTSVISAAGIAATMVTGCSKDSGQQAPSPAASSTAVDESGAMTSKTQGSIVTSHSTPGGSKVYATSDISADGLLAVYHALSFQPSGKVAVKLHMGEQGNDYYVHPTLVDDLRTEVNGTYVDTTVLYGVRNTADGYASLATQHGFSPVDILDSDGGMALPISGGRHLSEALVGSHVDDYQSFISVAHFKGHAMAGFGGTFKNLAIGLATIQGKMSVHGSDFETGEPFIERVAEFAKGVFDHFGSNMVCINVLNNLSVDCDCDSSPEKPTMADIAIMASLNPVALDQASFDQILYSKDPGKQSVIDRIESRDGQHLPEYAESLGIGNKTYELVVLD